LWCTLYADDVQLRTSVRRAMSVEILLHRCTNNRTVKELPQVNNLQGHSRSSEMARLGRRYSASDLEKSFSFEM